MRNPVSRFAYSRSDIGLKRSMFERSHDHKTTLSAGVLYPLLLDEVLPGDTYSVDMSSLVRMATPIHPVMDNCFLDTYWFFVPNRIVWDHWKEFMGESPSDPYINPVEYSVPQLTVDASIGIPQNSILDYMGVPPQTKITSVNALPVRGFAKIWNEWFRDQNLQNAINISTGDTNLEAASSEDDDWYDNITSPEIGSQDRYVTSSGRGGVLPPVNKYHDYFTSALKEPQKGDPVAIPLSGYAPVYATSNIDVAYTGSNKVYSEKLRVVSRDTDAALGGNLQTNSNGEVGVSTSTSDIDGYIGFQNLGADLSRTAGIYATISDLRYAFQLQKFLEADNRGGTRYREILKQHFGVTSPDASQQIPEFLGGKRIPINISQVLQTSSTDTTSPQGNTAAYSLTTDKYSAFTKSFTEHGFLFCVGCIRTEHTYAQGLEKMWSRSNKFDYYFPEFANISEQPIYTRELFCGSVTNPEVGYGDSIFGFQEPWSEYKYKPNRVSSAFRPQYRGGSLDVWHYADYYTDQPYLSSEWIRETPVNVARTLAVTTGPQFIADFYFKMNTVRCMPVYSIPGLSDHH